MDQEVMTKLAAAKPGVLTEAYLKLRDRRDNIRAQEKEIVARMGVIETLLLNKLQELQQEGFKARDAFGVAYVVYKNIQQSVKVTNRDAFFAYVKEHDAYQLLEARVSKEAALMVQTDTGNLPDGVSSSECIVLGCHKA